MIAICIPVAVRERVALPSECRWQFVGGAQVGEGGHVPHSGAQEGAEPRELQPRRAPAQVRHHAPAGQGGRSCGSESAGPRALKVVDLKLGAQVVLTWWAHSCVQIQVTSPEHHGKESI